MSKQNESGRAFEFAVLSALLQKCEKSVNVALSETKALLQAKLAFEGAEPGKKLELQLAATAGIDTFCLLEPRVLDPTLPDPVILSLQEDTMGQKGDPRDVVVQRGEWMVGLSAKHESPWIKSPRLSNLASFGKNWLGVECTDEYKTEVTNAFAAIDAYKGTNWNELPPGVKNEVYDGVLSAFCAELLRLQGLHADIIPQKLMQFLLGNHDYYRLSRLGSTTQLQPFNIYGTLAKKVGARHPITPIKQLPLPTRFLTIERASWDTMRIFFDGGWQIAMRAHNKDREIKQSLAFETSILGQPSALLTLLMPWGLTPVHSSKLLSSSEITAPQKPGTVYNQCQPHWNQE
ncbi:MAG: HaeIII family restriction endonuclease [Candidatus Obscuribacterales bacterium]